MEKNSQYNYGAVLLPAACAGFLPLMPKVIFESYRKFRKFR